MATITQAPSLVIFFFLCLDIGVAVVTQCTKDISTKGQHFIVTVPPVVSTRDFDLGVYISSNQDGYALVNKYSGHVPVMVGNYSLHQGKTVSIQMRGNSIHQKSTGKQTRGLEIMSSTDVAVYVAGYEPNVAAGFAVFPTQLASQQYVIPTYKTFFSSEPNYLLITSLQNDTHISVNNYVSNGNTFNTTLTRLESYTSKTLSDLALAMVRSNKPVNIVVGNTCTRVKNDDGNCDPLYDAPVPVRFWGQTFIVPPTTPKSGSLVRLYPKSVNTTVTIEYSNTTVQTNVSFQGMHELLLGTDPTVIVSDQPLNVVQYGLTGDDGDDGDAFMTSVPAVSHYSNDYVFPTPFSENGFVYRVAITIESKHLSGLLLDGSAVSSLSHIGNWNVHAPLEKYIVVALELTPGNHTLRHQSPDVRFSVLLYGYKRLFGFGFNLGFSFPIKEHVCQNGGSCTSDGKCICLLGFSGESCEINSGGCSNVQCHNGGTCIDGITEFACRCRSGWTGKYCERNIDECSSSPCRNGAVCTDGIGHFNCTCTTGWTGQHCETALTSGVSSGELTCFACDYTTALSFCDSVQTCQPNQMCFLQRSKNSNGHNHFRSGCQDRQKCTQHNEHADDTCLECCDGSFCNSKGCGDIGFPPKGSRGPICLDCAYASDPRECDRVTICDSDELCHVEELQWGPKSIFHLGCKSNHECAFETRSLTGNTRELVQRSVPLCKACCQGDFCNTNCTRPVNSNHIIVG